MAVLYDRSLQILERASQTLVDLLNTSKINSVRLGAFQDECEMRAVRCTVA